jgi:hypothetical protein
VKRILATIILLCAPVFAGTCGSGYTFSYKFTVLPAKVPNTDQTNFPVLVAFNGASSFNYLYLSGLKTVANGGQIQNTANNSISISGPADLIFCDAASAGNALKFEVAKYDATTGLMETYVKIPTLSHTTNTSFWMFYGNAGVVTSQQDLSMWTDALFVSVYHFGSLTADSASGLTLTNTAVTSSSTNIVAGNSAVFNGTTAFLQASSSTGLGISTLSAEFWLNPTSIGAGNSNSFIADFNTSVTTGGFWLRNFNSQLDFVGFTGAGASYADRSTANILSASAWSYYAETVTGTTRAMYFNGASTATTVAGGTPATLNTTVQPIQIGGLNVPSFFTPGAMDEVRVSSTVRSADWIATTYNVESSPVEFALAQAVVPNTGVRIVQYNSCGNTSPVVCAFLNNVTSGNTIVAVLGGGDGITCGAGTINTVFTDTRSSTFTFINATTDSTGLVNSSTCFGFAVLGSSGAETITGTGTANSKSMQIYEIAGMSSPTVDAINNATADSVSTISTGSATATTANSMVVCGYAGAQNASNYIRVNSVSPTTAQVINSIPNSTSTYGASSIIQFTGSLGEISQDETTLVVPTVVRGKLWRTDL